MAVQRLSFPDHFSTVAQDYASYRPQYDEALVDRLAARCGERTRAWDVATGSGQIARLLADRFGAVIATDASADQVRFAPPHPRITYRVETAESPSLPDHSVDLITVAAGMHWFREEAFYDAVRRVARPGALLAMFSYGTDLSGDPDLFEVVKRYQEEILGPWWPPQYAIIQSQYASLSPPFEELAWPGSVAHCLADYDALRGMLRTWSGAAIMARQTGQDPTEAIAADLLRAWEQSGAPEEPRRLTWPVFGRLVRIP